MRRFRIDRPQPGAAAVVLAIAVAGTSAADPPVRVGLGDPRAGYESTDFETRSQRLTIVSGERLDLAALAAKAPLGLPPLEPAPDGELIDLGRRLFFDRGMSANGTLSCGMCHVPEQAFTQNEMATPVGFEGRFVRRNAPSLYNVGYRRLLFHDGRESSLAEQVWSPLLATNEMANSSRTAVLQRVAAVTDYADAFGRLFPDGLTAANLGAALAAYQRALLSANSPFDRWFYGGEATVTPAAQRGFFTFVEAGCHRCHTFGNRAALFTDDELHRTGVGHRSRRLADRLPGRLQLAPGVSVDIDAGASLPGPDRTDDGAFEVTGQPQDRWRYRTPSLRNVALTAPYMHDGSLPTLAAVIAFYDSGAGDDPRRDPALTPLNLSPGARSDLQAFLESLTGDNVDALAADARSAPIGGRRADSTPPAG